MSAEGYKRDLVRQWCDAVTAAPFVASVNESERPPATSLWWFTIVWEPDQAAPISFGGGGQESGLLNVIVAGAPAIGDAATAAKSDEVLAELLANTDPESRFTIIGTQATAEHSAGTADRYYRLNTPLNYLFVTGGP